CLGIVYGQRDQPAAAAARFERALELRPEVPAYARNLAQATAAAHTERGMVLAGLKEWNEAVACYRAAIDAAPDYLPALGNLGNVLKSLGQFQAAADCYRNVLRLEPRSAEAHYNLGLLAKEQQDFVEAAHCCRRAIELQPNYALAHYELGSNLVRQNKLE